MATVSQTPSIYQIRHIESGKVYVGSAINPRDRWRLHQHALKHGRHHSRHLQRAWNKYGAEAFVFEIIEPVLFIEDLIAREQHWITALRSFDGSRGFNVSPTAGSTQGLKHSDEARAANAARANAQFADPAARAANRERTKAQFADPAARARASEKTKSQWADPEWRAKMLAHLKEIHADPEVQARRVASTKKTFADPEWQATQADRRARRKRS